MILKIFMVDLSKSSDLIGDELIVPPRSQKLLYLVKNWSSMLRLYFLFFPFNMIDFNFADFQNEFSKIEELLLNRYLIQNGNGHGIILLKHC
jgi:hypothetical protein